MSFISVFDVMGPNMIGPSSSHTAGAARIALLARKLLTGSLKKVEFTLYGSFAKTYHGHGTDRALLGGIMGFATDDVRIRDSFQIATDNGIEYSFIPNNVETDVHPNTVDILMVNEEGQEMTIRGESLGGGKARLCTERDVLRQCAVFHHGHFIEAKLHFLALLCFLENLAQRAPALTRPAAHAAPHGAAFSISCAIRAAPARASPRRAIFRFIIPYFPGSAKSPAGAVCISCRKNIHFRQIVRTRSNIVVCSIL